MKTFSGKFVYGALCAVGLTLTGCASVAEKMNNVPQETDYAKVAAIEAVARARGVSVYWYRYPTKPVASLATPAIPASPVPTTPAP